MGRQGMDSLSPLGQGPIGRAVRIVFGSECGCETEGTSDTPSGADNLGSGAGHLQRLRFRLRIVSERRSHSRWNSYR